MPTARIYITLITCAVLVIVFGLTPLIKWQLETRLAKFLSLDVSIGAIALNPLSGTLVINELEVADVLTLSEGVIELALKPLSRRHIHVKKITLHGLHSNIRKNGDVTNIGGFKVPANDVDMNNAKTTSWTYQLDSIEVNETQLNLALDEQSHQLFISSMNAGPIITDPEAPVNVAIKFQLGATTVGVEGQYQSALSSQHNFQGQLTLSDFDLKLLEPFLKQPMAGTLTTEQNVNLNGDANNFIVKLQGPSEIINLSYKHLRFGNVSSEQNFQASKSHEQLNITSLGDIKFNKISFEQYDVEKMHWQGTLAFEKIPEHSANFLGFEMRVDGDVSASGISNQVFGKVEKIDFTSVSFVSGKKLEAESLMISGDQSTLTIKKGGELKELKSDIKQTDIEVASESIPSGEFEKLLPLDGINIARFDIKEGNLHFRDKKVTPEITLALSGINLSVAPLSRNRLLDYKLTANHQKDVRRAANITSAGKFQVSEQLTGEASLTLKNFELHEISAYMDDSVQSGRLTLDADLKIESGLVHLKNHILIESMKMSDTNATSKNSDGASVALALYLLKDKHGDIELDVPIETDLDNFSIGTQGIVSKALQGAAQKTALNYAKFALQPYGSLLLLKDIAGAITQPRFEPITFAPRSTDLTEEAIGYVKKIAKMLNDRPEMRITICGVSTELDIPVPVATKSDDAIDSTAKAEKPIKAEPSIPAPTFLLALAKRRGDKIRQEMENNGVVATRIFSCKPTVEKTETEARVELSL